MSVSEDNDDFLSAEEDVFDNEEQEYIPVEKLDNRTTSDLDLNKKSLKFEPIIRTKTTTKHKIQLADDADIKDIQQITQIRDKFDDTKKEEKTVGESKTTDDDHGGSPPQTVRHTFASKADTTTAIITTTIETNVESSLSETDSQTQPQEMKINVDTIDEEPNYILDEDEGDSERLRERNLSIVKNSVELVKNIKTATQPIPIKRNAAAQMELESSARYNSSSSSSSSRNQEPKSSLPPAPPPTPALSSSFNTSDSTDPTMTTSQYNWRVPNQVKPQKASPPPDDSKVSDSKSDHPKSEPMIDQARSVLDKLAEGSSSFSDPLSLLRSVTEDLKRVTIKPSQTMASASAATPPGESSGETSGLGEPLSRIIAGAQPFSGWSWDMFKDPDFSWATSMLAPATDSSQKQQQPATEQMQPQQQNKQQDQEHQHQEPPYYQQAVSSSSNLTSERRERQYGAETLRARKPRHDKSD